MQQELQLFPEAASSMAGTVDALFFYLLGVSLFFGLLTSFLVIFFAVRYRRQAKVNRTIKMKSSLPLEVTWSVIPLILVMTFFAWGAKVFFDLKRPPADAMEIYVVAKQWMWKLQHAEGRSEINELHIPVGQPVKLRMTSEDVIHSFFVPAFRVKMDVLPGRYTEVWFEPTKPGVYHLFCAEYCGTEHSGMTGRVVVMPPADYAAWIQGGVPGESAEVAGKKVFERQRCNTCHVEQANVRAPLLKDLMGSEVELADGTTAIADEDYIRESILQPNAKVVAGYDPVMPTYKGQIKESEIFELIAYIKTLTDGDANASPNESQSEAPAQP